MKYLVSILLIFCPPAHAQSFSQFLKDAVASAEMDSAFNLKGGKFAAAYVPLRSLNLTGSAVADVGFGGVFGAGAPQGLASARVNIPQLVNLLFGTKWFVTNTSGPTLPTLFIGPSVKMAWPINTWTWRTDTFLLIGIPLSSLL